MNEKKKDGLFSDFQFPQLNRFTAQKFSAELHVQGGGRKLESRFVETFRFLLESAPAATADSMSPNDRVRISVLLTLEGDWRDKDSEVKVASFEGSYRAIFNFTKEIGAEELNNQLQQDAYRDFLAVQVYPIAKSHMFSQVGMLGININKRLGLDIYAQREVLGPVPKKKRSLRK